MEQLDRKQLSKIFKKKFPDGNFYYYDKNNYYFSIEECPICMENLHGNVTILNCPDANKKVTNHCCHRFHTHCIEQALERNNTCPVCRTPIRESRILPISPLDITSDDIVLLQEGGKRKKSKRKIRKTRKTRKTRRTRRIRKT
jgi:hypothetical protein